MINSLSKDSHITQYHRFYNSGYDSNQKNTGTNASKSATVINQDILVKKPAEISFSGFSNAHLANEEVFKQLFAAARKLIGGEGKEQHVKVVKLIKESVDYVLPQVAKEGVELKAKPEPPQLTKSFIDSQKDLIDKIIAKTNEFEIEEQSIKIIENGAEVSKRNPDGSVKLRKDPEEMRKEIMGAIEKAANSSSAFDKKHWYENKNWLKTFLLSANKNSVVFSATFSLLLTCILRPASIMTLPIDKKSKDDQKYASAHSVASGIIGFCISWLVTKPLSDAVSKVLKDPFNRANDPAKPYIQKYGEYLENSLKANECGKQWVMRGADILMAVPKAMITIALIPPILKYVFHWEKKKSGQVSVTNAAKMPVMPDNKKQAVIGGVK